MVNSNYTQRETALEILYGPNLAEVWPKSGRTSVDPTTSCYGAPDGSGAVFIQLRTSQNAWGVEKGHHTSPKFGRKN